MCRCSLMVAIWIGVLACGLHAQPAGEAFYKDLSLLPYVYSGVESYYLSSYDRTGGNDDGFRGTYSQLYVDDNGEHVIFDEKGPGCIYNLWFTGSDQDLHWGTIRFYFDDEKSPRIVCDGREFFNGALSAFVYPLITNAFISSGGFSCSAPIEFAGRLKVTTEKTVGFYNVYYQLYEKAKVRTWTQQKDYADLINVFERCGADPKPARAMQTVRKSVTLAAARGKARRRICWRCRTRDDSAYQDQPALCRINTA